MPSHLLIFLSLYFTHSLSLCLSFFISVCLFFRLYHLLPSLFPCIFICSFLKSGPIQASFLLIFVLFLITISKIQIERYIDGVLICSVTIQNVFLIVPQILKVHLPHLFQITNSLQNSLSLHTVFHSNNTKTPSRSSPIPPLK